MRKAVSADWYALYVGADPWNKEVQSKKLSSAKLIQEIARFPDDYPPFAVQHAIVLECKPAMAFNPDYVGPVSNNPPVEPDVD